MRLGDALIASHQMGTVLSNGVKLALEGFVFHAANGALADEQLLKRWHGSAGGLADIGNIGVGGKLSPANKCLAGVLNGLFNDGFAAGR